VCISVLASQTLKLRGARMELNDCTGPAARLGDRVVGAGGGGSFVGTIVTGSPTVCVG
jgi:hypothetical protein